MFAVLLLAATPAYGGAPGAGLEGSGAATGRPVKTDSPKEEGLKNPGEATHEEVLEGSEADVSPAPAEDGSENPETPAQGEAEAGRETDWLTAPPDPDRHSVWIPAAEWAVALSLTIPLFIAEPEFVHTGELSADTFADSWTKGPVWDSDGVLANYVFHPIMGAEAYLTLRNRDYGRFQSFLFSTGVSFGWEYLFEAWQERPSGQDLLVTSTAGSLLGELRFQIRRRLSQWEPSLGRNVLIVLVDPIEAIHRYIGTFDDDDEPTAASMLNVGPGEAGVMFTMQF